MSSGRYRFSLGIFLAGGGIVGLNYVEMHACRGHPYAFMDPVAFVWRAVALGCVVAGAIGLASDLVELRLLPAGPGTLRISLAICGALALLSVAVAWFACWPLASFALVAAALLTGGVALVMRKRRIEQRMKEIADEPP